jgi:hypothetical protein
MSIVPAGSMKTEVSSGEQPDKYQGVTGRKPPYTIPKDAGAESAIFSGPKIDNENISSTAYRFSPDMERVPWTEHDSGHARGPKPATIAFGALLPQTIINPLKADAIGLGEGEKTPFSAQRGEMPE